MASASPRASTTPGGVAVDAAGNVLVADAFNDTIRRVSPLGEVTTVAGSPQIAGTADGSGAAARFNLPYGVAVDLAGNIYVADTLNRDIREISTNGAVKTIAGTPGSAGYLDGPAADALFRDPYGLAVDRAGVVYVADTLNNRVRQISHGYVTTLAGDGAPGALNGLGTNAEFNEPLALAPDAAGNLYVADYGSSTIRKITPSSLVSTIAGSAGQPGSSDGTNGAARFNLPSGIAVDASGNVFVADFGNQTIRKLAPDNNGNWIVTTPAGFPSVPGDTDGTALGARFHGPAGLALDNPRLFLRRRLPQRPRSQNDARRLRLHPRRPGPQLRQRRRPVSRQPPERPLRRRPRSLRRRLHLRHRQ